MNSLEYPEHLLRVTSESRRRYRSAVHYSRLARKHTDRSPGWLLAPILSALALLPAFLGGGTERWSEGVVFCLVGLLLIIEPPRQSLGKITHFVFAGLLLAACTAFLPARWFGFPGWRTVATQNFGIDLPTSISPQPWITGEAILIMLGGMAWFYLVSSATLLAHRRLAIRSFCAGAGVFAGACIGIYLAHWKWPFAGSVAKFGPFPNRNQTADLLALSTIVCMGCVHEDFRHKKQTWMIWLANCGLLLAGLLLAGSRAGILLCFIGVAAWGAALFNIRRSTSHLFTIAAVLVAMLGIVLFGGRNIWQRFFPHHPGTKLVNAELRWPIQRTALTLGSSTPLTGIGLGNFEGEFSLLPEAARVAPTMRVLHPESDWIWVYTELGVPGLVLVAVGIAWIAKGIFPLGADRDWRLRAAAGAALLAFVIHGFVDVSGHRLGSAFPALFIAALAALRSSRGQRIHPSPSWLPITFRAMGAGLLCLGAVWAFCGVNDWSLPGTIGVEAANRRASQMLASKQFIAAATLSSPALSWAPLDWRLYYIRGAALANSSGDNGTATDDLDRALFLNPTTPELPYDEGLIWLNIKPALTLPPWREALKRSLPAQRAEFFSSMMQVSLRVPDVRDALIQLPDEYSELIPVALELATPEEFNVNLTKLLTRDPQLKSLSRAVKKELFQEWPQKGDKEQFIKAMESHEAWMRQGWAPLANVYAGRKDYEDACHLAIQHLSQPVLPKLSGSNIIALRHSLYLNPHDFATGYMLYDAEMRLGDAPAALKVLQQLTQNSDCPSYFYFLQAKLLIANENWKEAWISLKQSGMVDPDQPAASNGASPNAL